MKRYFFIMILATSCLSASLLAQEMPRWKILQHRRYRCPRRRYLPIWFLASKWRSRVCGTVPNCNRR